LRKKSHGVVVIRGQPAARIFFESPFAALERDVELFATLMWRLSEGLRGTV
jgi:hypothetical protein